MSAILMTIAALALFVAAMFGVASILTRFTRLDMFEASALVLAAVVGLSLGWLLIA